MLLLAAANVETILDGHHPAAMTLAVIMKPFAVGWREQMTIGFCPVTSRSD